ncbi:hypothetical protein [Leekyejoonella antrihumi]|uniref:Uncharacterized protein n=1 Tax=Leekyejoonella antrihumi TaxID=1660198 RepID=A0A563E032_9MICO|nr:hypothetical protein [Leekyejoonella antrihumi]TWP35593.1 hypothetical protein FGL98_13530 [Leekyejoonella antrihumi]
MLWLILALLVSVVLAAVVVGLVAVPARREGRAMLTERGETLVSSVAERKERVATTAKKTGASVTRRSGKSDGQSVETSDNTASDESATATEPAAAHPADTEDSGSDAQKTAG